MRSESGGHRAPRHCGELLAQGSRHARIGHDFAERGEEPVVPGGRKPLQLVFIGARLESEKLRDGAIQPRGRIRILPLAVELQFVAVPAPARPATEIAGMVERQNGGVFKWRCEKSGCRMGQVMLDDGNLGPGE